ncbi:YdhK family protein [Priestia megaterium]|uniref:YdhK family protein n=1 Tax=Priestia megaterium TaxID=1404 RepID=A0A6H1PAX7_PRIMG|nr:YdhK family protein [Priestia megaterium]QIZ10562.1 YdhK family protein [Priestia megaterium]
MKSKRLVVGFVSFVLMLLLSACGSNSDQKSEDEKNKNMDHKNMNMDHMGHSSSGQIPKGLIEKENPTYKVGNQAIIKADHMEGMNGAKATIVGAYDTTAYVVSYTPTTGGEKVKNHKWVIQEEIKNTGSETLKPGTEVTIEADHMEGMKGATGTIDSAEQTTVYMIDYTPAAGGEKVKNHKWVTESELSTK